jgi:hypothetical protein
MVFIGMHAKGEFEKGHFELKRVNRFLVVGNSRPLAEVKPISSPDESLRPYGLAAGRFATPDDFDRPLPAEALQDFEGR